MKMKSFGRTAPRFLLGAALLLGAACDNPVDSGDDHPDGLVVLNASGQQVASYDADTRTATGSPLAVSASGVQTYRVVLTTHGGGQIVPDGVEYRLGATVVLDARATAAIQGVDQLVLTGKAAGNSSVVITVFHGGHAEFDATIPLTVTP